MSQFLQTNYGYIVVTTANKIVIKKESEILQSDMCLFNFVSSNDKIYISYIFDNKSYYFGVCDNMIVPVDNIFYFDNQYNSGTLYYNNSIVLFDIYHEHHDFINLLSGVALSINAIVSNGKTINDITNEKKLIVLKEKLSNFGSVLKCVELDKYICIIDDKIVLKSENEINKITESYLFYIDHVYSSVTIQTVHNNKIGSIICENKLLWFKYGTDTIEPICINSDHGYMKFVNGINEPLYLNNILNNIGSFTIQIEKIDEHNKFIPFVEQQMLEETNFYKATKQSDIKINNETEEHAENYRSQIIFNGQKIKSSYGYLVVSNGQLTIKKEPIKGDSTRFCINNITCSAVQLITIHNGHVGSVFAIDGKLIFLNTCSAFGNIFMSSEEDKFIFNIKSEGDTDNSYEKKYMVYNNGLQVGKGIPIMFDTQNFIL